MPLLMLREAYQATARPCPRRAIREVTLLSSCAMVLLFVIMSQRIPFPFRAGMDHLPWLNLFLLGLLLSPLLCMFRAGLILQGDRSKPLAARPAQGGIGARLIAIFCSEACGAICWRRWRWHLRRLAVCFSHGTPP